jgi:hypothetical protein
MEQTGQGLSEEHKHAFEIYVNTVKVLTDHHKLDYHQVVKIAFPNETQRRYNVTYRGAKDPREGHLVPGGPSVEIKQGTIFDVTPTTES